MNTTILKVVVGSRMWGTNTPESDTDYKEVVMAPLRDVLNPFKNHGKGIQRQDEDNDTAVYELMHFLRLCEKGNPTMLEVLYTPLVEGMTEVGRALRVHRGAWLDSQKIINATLGMSKAQMVRADRYTRENPRDLRIGKLYASTLLSLQLSHDVVYSFGQMDDIRPSPIRPFLIDLKTGKVEDYRTARTYIEKQENTLREFETLSDGFVADKTLIAEFCYDWYRKDR